MNFSIFTGKIIQKSIFNSIKGDKYIHITLVIPNNKKEIDFYCVTAVANDEIAKDIIKLYQIGDSVIIESSILIKKYQDKLSGRIHKFMLFRIYDIHPTYNILNNFV